MSVRAAREGDSAALWRVQQAILRAEHGCVLTPSEGSDEAELRVSLQRLPSERERRRWLLGFEGEALVSEGTLTRFRPSFVNHSAVLSLGVDPSAQGRGHGRAMMEALIAEARAWPGVARIELSVRADNVRALALYQSLGFAHEGTRRAFVRTPDGRVIDDWICALWL